jgi:hypothetical protein
MGARTRNFYKDVLSRCGYPREADAIQEHYLAGRAEAAAACVPQRFLELTNLCGPAGFVAERIAAFRAAGVTDLQVSPVPAPGQRSVDLIERVRALAG